MNGERARVGLVAGNGQFPFLFARGARKAGLKVIAVGHHHETDSQLEQEVDELKWVHVGQIGKIARFFQSREVSEAAFVGGIGKIRAFGYARPDWLMLKTVTRLRHFNDDGLLRAIAQSFEGEGIRIIPSTEFLQEVLAPSGVLTRRQPNEQEERDLALGFEVAHAIGRADVGQTVITFRGNVIAVEAAEGTDACIQRAAEIAGQGIVVVKRCKPNQDLRFDLPAVGPKTIEVISQARGAVLGFDAGRTVLIDLPKLVQLANQASISVVGR